MFQIIPRIGLCSAASLPSKSHLDIQDTAKWTCWQIFCTSSHWGVYKLRLKRSWSTVEDLSRSRRLPTNWTPCQMGWTIFACCYVATSRKDSLIYILLPTNGAIPLMPVIAFSGFPSLFYSLPPLSCSLQKGFFILPAQLPSLILRWAPSTTTSKEH